MVAYNAATTLAETLSRIPEPVWNLVEEVCVFDDASSDATYEAGLEYQTKSRLGKLKIYRNDTNQGYGGNQKLAYRYAIKKGFDIAVLLHGDGQYAPEVMMSLLEPLLEERADAVMGSRMMDPGAALKGGMPLYKYMGNKVLSCFENILLSEKLSEYHSGYRAYNLHALAELPFDRNTDDFHFDTQIIIQLLTAGARIIEVPIPTHYGDEICHVNGFKYAFDVARSVLNYKLHVLGLKHVPEYHITHKTHYPPRSEPYEVMDRISELIPAGSTVLDVGCDAGHLAEMLSNKGCTVDGVDPQPGIAAKHACKRIIEADLTSDFHELLFQPGRKYDRIVIADQLEHLQNPSALLRNLANLLADDGRIVASTGNIAHWFIRLGLLLGKFNYTPRGILDNTHVRLYTLQSFAGLFEEAGFKTTSVDVTVMPVKEILPALEKNVLAKTFAKLYYRAARTHPGIFAYQLVLEVAKRPDPLDGILEQGGDWNKQGVSPIK